jgi:hypothetical protein
LAPSEGILRECALDACGVRRDGRPVDVGTGLLLDRGDHGLEADGDPALDQGADDEHTKDGGTLGDLAEPAAREVLRDVSTGLVASLLGVPEEGEADDVPEHKEQDGAKRRTAQRQGGTKGTQQRAHRVPEDRVADAGERTHHTDLDALDGDVVDGLAVGAALLEGEGDADDGGGDVRVRVVELEVTLQGRDLVILVGIELLDRRDHGVAPAAVLHTLVVPRALQVLVTVAHRKTILLGKVDALVLNLFCHC